MFLEVLNPTITMETSFTHPVVHSTKSEAVKKDGHEVCCKRCQEESCVVKKELNKGPEEDPLPKYPKSPTPTNSLNPTPPSPSSEIVVNSNILVDLLKMAWLKFKNFFKENFEKVKEFFKSSATRHYTCSQVKKSLDEVSAWARNADDRIKRLSNALKDVIRSEKATEKRTHALEKILEEVSDTVKTFKLENDKLNQRLTQVETQNVHQEAEIRELRNDLINIRVELDTANSLIRELKDAKSNP